MSKVSSFPLISRTEFEEACVMLSSKFQQQCHLQDEWLSVELSRQNETEYLKIVKPLSISEFDSDHATAESEENEVEESDEEALIDLPVRQITVEYDIVLSPSYQVPVLYFNIKDPSFRTPPTMDTLYQHLIPPQFKAQAENVGVIGGVTVTDHPITNSPVFFIHPCQTAAVLEASTTNEHITPIDYLTMWIGAMGKCVGLDMPIALVQEQI